MKMKDEREREKKKRQKETKRWPSYSESVKAKWFCCAFKLGFIQLMCKACLIFKYNLELASSVILKERESCESKHAGGV